MEVGRVSGRTRLKRSSRSIRARSRARRAIAPEVGLVCSSSDETEVSLARRKSRADETEVSLQLLDPSEWKVAGYGGFFREENITGFEARSILYAVRYAESNYPPGRLVILSDNLALVLARSKGRSTHIILLSAVRRIFACGLRGFAVSFRWIPSELNDSDEGRCFFDRCCDPSKSLLRVLAQRSPLFLPARARDQDCPSHSLLHLDVW